jgi:hypothetical protein
LSIFFKSWLLHGACEFYRENGNMGEIVREFTCNFIRLMCVCMCLGLYLKN